MNQAMTMKRRVAFGCLLAMGVALADVKPSGDGARLALPPRDAHIDLSAMEVNETFTLFSRAIGSDGAAYRNGWQYLTRGGYVRTNPQEMAAKFDDAEKKLKIAGEFRTAAYRTWIWAGEEGAKTSFTVAEKDTLPAGRTFFLPYLVDLVTMTARPLPESDVVRNGDAVTFRNLPVKATPMALATRYQLHLVGDDIRDWRISVRVEPEDKILFKVGERPELVVDVLDANGNRVREDGALANLRWYRSQDPHTNEVVALDGRPIRRPMALDKAGAVTCEVSLRIPGYLGETEPKRLVPVPAKGDETGHLGADGKNNAVKMQAQDFGRVVGCVFDWEKIRPGKPVPDDIDRVWDRLLEEDAKLPIEVKSCQFLRATGSGVRIYRVVLNSLGGDVHAEVSIPKEAEDGKKFPIWCIFQAYGCSSMSTWPWEWAITIAPNAHSISNGMDRAYYANMTKRGGPLYDYGFDTNTNARFETTYFRNVLLRDVRAVRYLMSRPEWDREKVFYYGGSQGGYQAAAMMGLVPETTRLNLSCPWAIDLGGSQDHWRPKWGEGVKYCDPINLVHRARGKGQSVTLSFGVADVACPVDGIFAWLNALPKDVDFTARLFQNHGHDVPDNCKRYHVEIQRKPGEGAKIIPHFDLPRRYSN